MEYETITLERKDKIATITLNRPEQLNVFNMQMLDELVDAYGQADRDDGIRVIVLTGSGRAFSAGADLGKWFLPMSAERRRGEVCDVTRHFTERAALALTSAKKPTIASINGLAVGIGCTVPLTCDIRIASEEAKFGLSFVKVGVVPELGSSYFLPRLIGLGKACELIMTGRTIDAREAKEIGLVNQVVPADELAGATLEMAAAIAEMPPMAVQLAKRVLYQGANTDLAGQLQYEALALEHLFGTEDFEEALRAFMEKRKPFFKGK